MVAAESPHEEAQLLLLLSLGLQDPPMRSVGGKVSLQGGLGAASPIGNEK